MELLVLQKLFLRRRDIPYLQNELFFSGLNDNLRTKLDRRIEWENVRSPSVFNIKYMTVSVLDFK